MRIRWGDCSLGSKSKEPKDDGNLHAQPADKDLGAREARPWLFAVEDAGWGWGSFRLLAQGQVLEVGEEALVKRCQHEEPGWLDHLF